MEASSVQPATPDPGTEPGQGVPAESQNGLYADVLEGIPNEFHESLTERLKGMDAKATQKFQQHSERVKPYEEAGVFDADPEELTSWLNLSQALARAMGDPASGQAPDEQAKEAVREWLDGVSGELGFNKESPEAGEGEGDLFDLTPKKLEEMITSQIAKANEPLIERFQEAEQQQAIQEAQQELNQQMSALREKYPDITDEDAEDIYGLAYLHGQDADDPISAGFERFKRMADRGETNLFQEKIQQPAPAEAGGMPNTGAPVPTSENAKDLAMERLKQMQGVT